ASLVRIAPLTQVLAMNLYWTLPPLFHAYASKSLHYVEHILGYEGKGSLFSLLRRRGWATALTAGNSDSGLYQNSSFFLFSLGIQLTPVGVRLYEQVLAHVFAYIELLS